MEDTFYYVILKACVMCGSCAAACPVNAIHEGNGRYEIDAGRCIDCGTCAYVCPLGAPGPV
ncbi:MAG: 4Fe-4S binding protein [Lachnospiraceae bacterium]|nr:4Fe-4S binding protein [Lachnospiraceae bacterium]